MQTQPDGYAAKKFLSKSAKKKVNKQSVLENLSRSFFHKSDIYRSLYVEAILRTPTSEYQKYKLLFQSKRITKSELKQKVKEVKEKYSKQVCFDLLVKSNDDQVLREKPWNVKLTQGKSRSESITISRFEEKTAKSVFATVDRNFAHVKDDMQYFLETDFCFEKTQKFKDQLVLVLAPEFHNELDEITLSWWFD